MIIHWVLFKELKIQFSHWEPVGMVRSKINSDILTENTCRDMKFNLFRYVREIFLNIMLKISIGQIQLLFT